MPSPAGAGLAVGAVEQNARGLHSDAVVGAFGRDCKQIERYDADMADGKLSPQPLPARGGEAREAVYLLDQENVAGLSIG
jgi:hypothetical protein